MALRRIESGIGVLLAVGMGCDPSPPGETSGNTETSEGSTTEVGAGTVDTGAPSSSTSTEGEASTGSSGSSSSSSADSSGGLEPPPPGGLEPWGYGFELLEDMHGDRVLMEDFDGDGHVDVFTQWRVAPEYTLRTHRGDGTGTGFVGGLASTLQWEPIPLAGDFDGDGLPDVASFSGGDGFFVALNDTSGDFVDSRFNPHPDPWSDANVALDVDGDLRDDLALPQLHSSGIDVLHGEGDGFFSFEANLLQPACYISGIVGTDLDADGWTDLVATGSCNGVPDYVPLIVYRGGPMGLAVEQTFSESDAAVHEGAMVLATDANGDGAMDIVTPVSTTALAVYSGDGSGSLAPPQIVPYAWTYRTLRLFELWLDPAGPAAYVMASDTPGQTAVAQWSGGALDTQAVELGGTLAGTADFNEDGRSDVVVLVPSDGREPDAVGVWLSIP